MIKLHHIILKKAYINLLCLQARITGKKLLIGSGSNVSHKAKIQVGRGTIEIGGKCRIHRYAILDTYGGWIKIGENVSVNPFSILYGHGGLKIGSYVRIAAHAVIIPANHRYEYKDQKIMEQGEKRMGINIENDVWIGSGAKILDSSHIVEGCVIGANCVVNGVTEPYSVYAGVPYKKIGERKAERKIVL